MKGCFRSMWPIIWRASMVVLMTGIAGGTARAAPSGKVFSNEAEPHSVYLPLVYKKYEEGAVFLVSPADGAVLNTLIPQLLWRMEEQPFGTMGQLYLDTHPQADQAALYYGAYEGEVSYVPWYNLSPATTYYWRVAMFRIDGQIIYSPERRFTTGSGGTILPAPVLTYPPDGSTVGGSSLTLTWQGVPGATAYRPLFHPLEGIGWHHFGDVTTNEYTLEYLEGIVNIYGTGFQWTVTARNDYAWGAQSDVWGFTIELPAGLKVGPN